MLVTFLHLRCEKVSKNAASAQSPLIACPLCIGGRITPFGVMAEGTGIEPDGFPHEPLSKRTPAPARITFHRRRVSAASVLFLGQTYHEHHDQQRVLLPMRLALS